MSNAVIVFESGPQILIFGGGPQGPQGPAGSGGGGLSGVISQFVITDAASGTPTVIRLVDGQLAAVGISNGESLSQIVMSEGGTDYVIKLISGQLVVVGTA